jgi:HTH-type transcriptional regulator/antitoxin HigA
MANEIEAGIRSEADYEKALAEIERYFDCEPAPGTPEAARFDALAAALACYEDEHWPLAAAGQVRSRPRRSTS